MKAQTITADIVSLTFSGTDQMTDAFWYLLAKKNIKFPQVTRVSMIGM